MSPSRLIPSGVMALSTIVLDPTHRIRPIATLEPLYLPFTQLQQEGEASRTLSLPFCCILNDFHALKLFLTHCHHPSRVTKSARIKADIILEHLHIGIRLSTEVPALCSNHAYNQNPARREGRLPP